jgi:hypothetical protein
MEKLEMGDALREIVEKYGSNKKIDPKVEEIVLLSNLHRDVKAQRELTAEQIRQAHNQIVSETKATRKGNKAAIRNLHREAARQIATALTNDNSSRILNSIPSQHPLFRK